MFNSGDQDRLEKDLALLRGRKTDSEAMRKFLSAPRGTRDPFVDLGSHAGAKARKVLTAPTAENGHTMTSPCRRSVVALGATALLAGISGRGKAADAGEESRCAEGDD